MAQRSRSGIAAALLVLVAIAAPACAVSGLSVRRDDRVDLLVPAERDEVTLPVRIDWEAHDLEIGPDAHRFGVLVDHTPPRPGRTLESLFADDDECHGVEGCPDDAFLARRLVFRTTETELTVDHVPPSTGERGFHVVTIVLLDESGARVGESAWSTRFQVEGQ